jgi:hypothetical protein
MKIITFVSDFKDEDWFVAAVKGEILKIIEDVTIIDITHSITPHDIRSTAFLLKCVYKNFPRGTIHLAVVDPGVGSTRKPLIVASRGYFFVGPDNGIFSYVFDGNCNVYEIKIKTPLSSTFHARDIFGPTAARLAQGLHPQQLGAQIKNVKILRFPTTKKKNNTVVGEIIYIDHFGNLITNISITAGIKELAVAKKRIPFRHFYGQGNPGELIAITGSCGYYEIACNQGSARDILSAHIGMTVKAIVSTQGEYSV